MNDRLAGLTGETLLARVRLGLVSAGRALLLGVLAYLPGLALFIVSVLSIAFIPLFGAGIVLVPVVLAAVRAYANLRRRLSLEWSGVEIPIPYRPAPPDGPMDAKAAWRRCTWMLGDPATWRDLLWLLVNVPIGLLLGILPAAMIVTGLEGMFVAPILGVLLDGGYPYTFGFFFDSPIEPVLAPPQGALLLVGGVLAGPHLLRASQYFTRSLLGPTNATLARRVEQLTTTRSDAVDAQAAELRRIERDLHDGAQARLVALGMSIGLAENLVAKNPDAALELLAEAREASGVALAELRGLVRGIQPPVLVERGVDGAIRALALALPLPVEVEIDLPARPEAPVESAAYFAVAEALANVAKHSGAANAWVRLRHADGSISMVVTDDGIGGADPGNGTGLRGVERRLAAFDGTLAVVSPPGGPTVVTMELPCVLSSPKTSPSSGTA
jgi:signal transduction histidine kinase